LTDLSHGAHGCQRARDNLSRSITIRIVGSLRFEQLGVGEDDAQLVVQAVKERLKLLAVLRFAGPGAGDRRRQAHAGEPGAVLVDSDSSERAGAAASRHRVSAKIRMDPPAVRTYSTLPAEIQL
jgi:hypothetical protein